MLRIMKYKWAKNEGKLKKALEAYKDLDSLEYKDLVRMTFREIFNSDGGYSQNLMLDLDNISCIDDGQYQGTLIFLIPFDRYQPSFYEYLMTYVEYGSCSGCDTLLGILYCSTGKDEQVKDLMTLCRDIVMHTIKPYNFINYYPFDKEDFEEVGIEED